MPLLKCSRTFAWPIADLTRLVFRPSFWGELFRNFCFRPRNRIIAACGDTKGLEPLCCLSCSSATCRTTLDLYRKRRGPRSCEPPQSNLKFYSEIFRKSKWVFMSSEFKINCLLIFTCSTVPAQQWLHCLDHSICECNNQLSLDFMFKTINFWKLVFSSNESWFLRVVYLDQ